MSELQDFYQQMILDHYRRPRNCRRIEGRVCSARGDNPLCGDKVTVFADVEGGVIRDIAFEGSGCAISTASASIMTESVKGKTVAEAHAVFERFHDMVTGRREPGEEGEDLGKLEIFAGVRQFPMRVKCATLAWHTLEAALTHPGETVTTE